MERRGRYALLSLATQDLMRVTATGNATVIRVTVVENVVVIRVIVIGNARSGARYCQWQRDSGLRYRYRKGGGDTRYCHWQRKI